EIQVKTLHDVRARGIIGTPSFLAMILDTVAAQGTRSSLEVAFVSGEPLPESLRGDLEGRHHVRISQAYAIGDIGLVAYECSQRSGLHLAERVLVEIVDPATAAPMPDGEIGEVAVTFPSDLYPLLRLGTGDLSRIAPGGRRGGREHPGHHPATRRRGGATSGDTRFRREEACRSKDVGVNMPDCVFCKIVAGAIPSQRVYEDDQVLAIRDINPQAPVHVLLLPKRHIASVLEITERHDVLLRRIVLAAGAI